jgi:hypothetical protein
VVASVPGVPVAEPAPRARRSVAGRVRAALPSFAAAAVALLFAGSWVYRPPAGCEREPVAFSSLAACFAPVTGPDGSDEAPTCMLDAEPGGSLAALASWGMCSRPSPQAALCAAPNRCASP